MVVTIDRDSTVLCTSCGIDSQVGHGPDGVTSFPFSAVCGMHRHSAGMNAHMSSMGALTLGLPTQPSTRRNSGNNDILENTNAILCKQNRSERHFYESLSGIT